MRNRMVFHALISALLLCAPWLQAQVAPVIGKPQSIELNRLEVTEELSESLANQLLDLSLAVRDCDLEKMADFFPGLLVAKPFPSQPLEGKTQVKWAATHGWRPKEGVVLASTGAPSGSINREDFMKGFADFLQHFSEIEDVRFKLKAATFDDTAQAMMGASVPTAIPGATGKGRVAFFVIGRDEQNRREWARGVVEGKFRYTEGNHWQFEAFDLTSFESMIGPTDLFSEVSLPAGIASSLPAFGTPGNDDFVYRGAAAADFNRDGWMDVMVCASDHPHLYLNDGHGHFRDASREAGLDKISSCVQPLALDYDNDGNEDVFLSNVGKQLLLHNEIKKGGKLLFADVSSKAGVAYQAVGFSAVAGDVNGDGLPDIYVTSYNHYGKIAPDSWFRATNGTKNLLFLNQGNGTFREVAEKWGVSDSRWSYAAELVDIDGDGKLDLYVVNDFGEKALYMNKGDRFVDEAKERGVLDSGNGMGVSFGDFNNDGLLDLHVTNMSSTAGNRILARLFPDQGPRDNVLKKLASGDSLFLNTGKGYFRNATDEVGGLSASWAWGGGFVDVDNDGWEDLYVPCGFISGKSMKDT
jgi:hypothetical protein